MLRSYYKSSYVKQYEKGNLLLRTETCLNDTYHLAIGRKLANLPALKQRLAATTDRYLEQQAELLDSTIDTGALAKLAPPVTVGSRRRYRLIADGVRLGALLVKIRTRLLGPIFAAPTSTRSPRSDHPSTVEAALRSVDHALDNLCQTLGLAAA